jgi:hypothetical protein
MPELSVDGAIDLTHVQRSSALAKRGTRASAKEVKRQSSKAAKQQSSKAAKQ